MSKKAEQAFIVSWWRNWWVSNSTWNRRNKTKGKSIGTGT